MHSALVAHALVRAVSALSTNLGANHWKQRTARSRGLWRQRRSRRDRLLLVPTPWLPGIQRRRQGWRRVTQGCVRHLRHLFFPTVCAEVSGKYENRTHPLPKAPPHEMLAHVIKYSGK